VQICVRTRGRRRELDYKFLGTPPRDFWWRDYGRVTDVERPTILLRSDGRSWAAYLAGMRSARLDGTDNSIQFSLALAGECGQGADNALALAILRRSARDLAAERGQFIPGGPLDAQLPAEEVDRMLVSPGKATADEVALAVRAAYAVPEPEPEAEPRERDQAAGRSAALVGDWIGGLADPAALVAFEALAARLLAAGCPGRAVALNLVDGEADLAELPRMEGALGVLAARPGPKLWTAVRILGKAGAPQEPAAKRRRRRTPRRWRTVALSLGGVAVVVALAILIAWLTGDPPR
jgi:hypothetical protein